MRAKIRDTELYFDVDGMGLVPDGAGMRERPTAFLIHGGPGTDHAGLKARYSKLAERMQLVYFDHRGNGRSARGNPQKYTLDENVEDMEALRKYLGLGPIVSIGTSYGGTVALAHAARYPDSVSHLIVVVAVSNSRYVSRAREIVIERGTAEQLQQCDDLFAGRIDTVEKMRHYFKTMGPLYSKTDDPALSSVGMTRAVLSPEAQNRAHGPGGFLRSYDLRPELQSITAPTLILAGRHDWICPPEFSEEIQQLIPGSELKIFENSGHSIASDEPQQFFDAVLGFLVYRRREIGFVGSPT